MFKRKKAAANQPEAGHPDSAAELFASLAKSDDFIHVQTNEIYSVSYYRAIIDGQVLHDDILSRLPNTFVPLETVKELMPFDQVSITADLQEIEQKLTTGYVSIQLIESPAFCLLLPAQAQFDRQVGKPELEFGIISSQEAFVENKEVNINLIRKRLPTTKLKIQELTVGTLSKTSISVMHIDGITDKSIVESVIKRIEDLDFDQILDGSYLAQMLYDNSNTIFPLFLYTERPDRVAAALTEGKVTIVVDRSPSVLIMPTTMLEYFQAIEDYNMPWISASAFRLLRMFAVVFSIYATPFYVAVLTFHYEIIPKDLLETIVSSRTLIPFPPIIEAIFLEISIELLREAGARLPDKVGQTLGIVGGIVIGQASVAAGLTSNILLIIVALSALSSFVTPIYVMGNAIRLIRFPFLLGAQCWGGLGIIVVSMFLLTHLIRLQSLNFPYLQPLYPTRLADWKDSFVRLPYSFFRERPENTHPTDKIRQKKKSVSKPSTDFDE